MSENEGKIDSYLDEVISKGDEGSSLLAKLTAPTLKNCKYVDIVREGMNGVAVLKKLPREYSVVVYSVSGNPQIRDITAYTESMVERLVNISKENNMIPLAFADVVDANKGDRKDIEIIGNTLKRMSDKYNLAILNGELAILGDRIKGSANINGTMIALVKSEYASSFKKKDYVIFENTPINLAVFEHHGKPVWINSDGIGTKTEFYERKGVFLEKSLMDSLAMKLDDTIKLGAEAKVVSDVIEYSDYNATNMLFSKKKFRDFAEGLNKYLGIEYILQMEEAHGRIEGYNKDSMTFNVSGSAVSLIDENRLKNPLTPREGNYLIAIRGHPNPRSNGITDKRKTMIKVFGEDYHETDIGKIFLEYLAAPSVILYPHFKELIDSNLATSVYHMSGGAYNGKLAKPLAKHNLFVNINNLFAPDWRELALGGASFTPANVAYSKWPMGNDGFVTTDNPDKVINYLKDKRLDGGIVGQLEKRSDGKTGIELTTFSGEKISYKGI